MHHNLAASYPGSVVLDIGGRTGALILYTDARRAGDEIDIQAVDGGRRTHAAVRERRLAGGTVHCAVYPELTAGTYTIEDPAAPGRAVTVAGGAVTELTLPG